MNGVKTLTEIKSLRKNLKKQKKKVVFTNGCFDLIHHGHIKIFKDSKQLGDILIVLVNSDKSIKKIKGVKEDKIIK